MKKSILYCNKSSVRARLKASSFVSQKLNTIEDMLLIISILKYNDTCHLSYTSVQCNYAKKVICNKSYINKPSQRCFYLKRNDTQTFIGYQNHC